MRLSNDFLVSASVEQVWEVLTNVERVALCLPGAQLVGREGDGYRGMVKVKVGPIRVQYEGLARFSQVDAAARIIVLSGEGRDTHGQGAASATVTAALRAEGEGTHVTVTTDLQITGKVAQFGRNVLSDVSDRVLAQFAHNLEREILGDRISETPDESSSQPARPLQPQTPEAVADSGYLDLFGTAGPAVARRAAPYAALLMGLFLLWLLVHRNR